MAKNHLTKSLIPKSATKKNIPIYINKDATSLFDPNLEGDSAFVFTSLRHVQNDFQCFSEWSKQEMKDFWAFNSSIHEKTWSLVHGTSTKNKRNKSGVAMTHMSTDLYPNSEFKKKLSPDITLFELRVTRKIRVHGFRDKSIFFICWLDKDHSICKM
tara:strand:+ start:1479 stop:1949 length:471 start_codon:yes stop_codon:yes gene_type:complete